jgi:hypothetical protein
MLVYLKEEMYQYVLPMLKKAEDSAAGWDKEKAERIVEEISEHLNNSVDSRTISTWYRDNKALYGAIQEFMDSKEPYVSEFGHKVDWLLAKGPHFYTDD